MLCCVGLHSLPSVHIEKKLAICMFQGGGQDSAKRGKTLPDNAEDRVCYLHVRMDGHTK